MVHRSKGKKAGLIRRDPVKLADLKLQNDIADVIRKIEKEIVPAALGGLRVVEVRFGDGKTRELAWEMAMARLKRINKKISFELRSTVGDYEAGEARWSLLVSF